MQAVDVASDLERRIVRVQGRDRYYLVSPAAEVPEGGASVVLAFHGGGTNPAIFARQTRLAQKTAGGSTTVVFPAGTGVDAPDGTLHMGLWNSGPHCFPPGDVDDLAFVEAILEDVDGQVRIDSRRVFATGYSNGAMMSYRLACERSDVVAAIAPHAGSLDVPQSVPSEPVSVLHFHGTADRLHPHLGGQGIVPEWPGPFLGAVESVKRFVGWNGCDPVGGVVRQAGCGTLTMHTGGRGGSEVGLWLLEGVGHQWPGWHVEIDPEAARQAGFPVLAHLGPSTSDVDASDEALAFFAAHPKRSSR